MGRRSREITGSAPEERDESRSGSPELALTRIAVNVKQAARFVGTDDKQGRSGTCGRELSVEDRSRTPEVPDPAIPSVSGNSTVASPRSIKPADAGDQPAALQIPSSILHSLPPAAAISPQSTLNTSGANLDTLSPSNRKAKPCMGKRSGQSGTIVRKGNYWHIRYLFDTPNGRIRKSVPVGRCDEITKTQARRLGDTYIHELGINTPQHLAQALAAPTFDIALQKWRDACLVGFKPSGQQSAKYIVQKHIEPKFCGKLLEQVDKQAVQLWINALEESGLAPKTVSNVVKMLKSILNWSDVGTRDWKLRMPEISDEEQRWFTEEEVEKIIKAAEGQYKVLFCLAYASGMRFGELAGLHATDFDFKNGTVRVQRGTFRNIEDTPKSQKGKRLIYLDTRTLEAVQTYLDGRASGRVFMTRTGTPLKDGDVNRDVLKPLCGQVGIPVGTMHAFRHGRVSRMQDNGVNEKVIQMEIGHSSLRMTQRYTHFSVKSRRATAEKLAI